MRWRSASRAAVAISTIVTIIALSGRGNAQSQEPDFVVVPERVELAGNFSRAQLLVRQSDSSGTTNERRDDLTAKSTYSSSDSKVVTVSATGQLLAVGNGEAEIS